MSSLLEVGKMGHAMEPRAKSPHSVPNGYRFMLKRAWQAWRRIAQKIGNFQARVVLTIFYAVVVFPFGMAARLFSDPLRIKSVPRNWLDHPNEPNDMKWAKRQ